LIDLSWLILFGFPEVIITDQGQEFNSVFFRSNLKSFGITHKRTTPGHPQTNGMAERFNRTLKDTLRKLCNNKVSSWEDTLASALWAYRISEMETRGSSPFYLLFGHLPNNPPQLHDEHRFENLALAQLHAYNKQVEAKQLRQDRSKYVPLNEHQVSVGDGITINCAEPVTLSHLRDNAFKVVSVKGKVVGYVPLFGKQPSKPRYINIDRVRPVPQNVSWDEINPRPRRNRTNTDVRTWTRPLELPNLHLSTGQNRVERDDGQRSPAPLPLIVQEVVSPEDLEELPRLADSSGDDESMIQKSIRPLRRSERLKRRWADEDQVIEGPSTSRQRVDAIWRL
jgi:hypothetical protein